MLRPYRVGSSECFSVLTSFDRFLASKVAGRITVNMTFNTYLASHLRDAASEMSEEASRWKRDKERWDKLWRGAKVRAAPIPKALAFLCSPLRLDKCESPFLRM